MKKTVYQHSLPLLAAGLLAACSSQTETPVEPINTDSSAAAIQLPGGRRSDSEEKVLADYQLFQSAQAALKQGDANQAAQFLA